MLHPLREKISAELDELYENDEDRLIEDLEGSDWLLVAVEAGEILEAMVYQTWDVEEEDIADDLIDSFDSCDMEGSVSTQNPGTERGVDEGDLASTIDDEET
jgi:hypothetical protein